MLKVLVVVFFINFLTLTVSVFEESAGSYDWIKENIGYPKNMIFSVSKFKFKSKQNSKNCERINSVDFI
jgi:hypothetical protein